MKSLPRRTKSAAVAAVNFMRSADFEKFSQHSKRHLAGIAKEFKLYPEPTAADYTYTEYFAGPGDPKTLQARLETRDLAPASRITVFPYIKIAGQLSAFRWGATPSAQKSLALIIDVVWEYFTHCELTPTTDLTVPQTSQLYTAVFDRAGTLAGLSVAVQSPAQIKTHRQLQSVGREIVYYKKQAELVVRYTQETARQRARAQKLCTRQNQLTDAGIILPNPLEG